MKKLLLSAVMAFGIMALVTGCCCFGDDCDKCDCGKDCKCTAEKNCEKKCCKASTCKTADKKSCDSCTVTK